MFGLFKSKPQKEDQANLELAASLVIPLELVLSYVPKHKYKDFFLVGYALFDHVFRHIPIDDKAFIGLFSVAMGNLGKPGKVDHQKYDDAFDEFIEEYLLEDFENLTDAELELMQMGAGLVNNARAGMGLTAYFMRENTD